MVILLITFALVLCFLAIAVSFWLKSAKASETIQLPPVIHPRSLFADRAITLDTGPTAPSEDELVSRARSEDFTVLVEAQKTSHYNQVLNVLVSQSTSEAKLFKLASYVKQNELPVNTALAKAMLRSWQAKPTRHSTAKALHFAALADDAGLYLETVEAAIKLRRDGQLHDLSATELLALISGEFWLLSSSVRNSGLGFVLKRSLASAKRELESANNN